MAKDHLKKSRLKIKYYSSSTKNVRLKKRFNNILNMEIVKRDVVYYFDIK